MLRFSGLKNAEKNGIVILIPGVNMEEISLRKGEGKCGKELFFC